jgi:hypothetical protein
METVKGKAKNKFNFSLKEKLVKVQTVNIAGVELDASKLYNLIEDLYSGYDNKWTRYNLDTNIGKVLKEMNVIRFDENMIEMGEEFDNFFRLYCSEYFSFLSKKGK